MSGFQRSLFVVTLSSVILVGAAAVQLPPMGAAGIGPQPTAEHEVLRDLEGHWSAAAKLHAKPGEAPYVFNGTEAIRSLCGGLWLTADNDLSKNTPPYEAHTVIGFDARKKQYSAQFFDTLRAEPVELAGTFDAARRELTFSGKASDPRDASKQVELSMVFTLPKSNKRKATHFLVDKDGGKTVWMETDYTFKKKR